MQNSKFIKNPDILVTLALYRIFIHLLFFLMIAVTKKIKIENNYHWLKLRIPEMSERILSIKFPHFSHILGNKNYPHTLLLPQDYKSFWKLQQ